MTVNAVCPGFIESDMTAELNEAYMEEVREAFIFVPDCLHWSNIDHSGSLDQFK